MGEYPITLEHFELYKKYTYEWLDIFKLNDYKIFFEQRETDDEYGWVTWECEERMACFGIAEEVDLEPTDEFIDEIAFHETFELILGELRLTAERRYAEEREIKTAVHSIIRRMENTVFKKYRGK